MRYVASPRSQGMGAAGVNQRLSAIHKLAQEAADNGDSSDSLAQGIRRAKRVRQEGVRQGFWLTQEQARALLDAPDTGTSTGLGDRAILALMIGCGLRRYGQALGFPGLATHDLRRTYAKLARKGGADLANTVDPRLRQLADHTTVSRGHPGLTGPSIRC